VLVERPVDEKITAERVAYLIMAERARYSKLEVGPCDRVRDRREASTLENGSIMFGQGQCKHGILEKDE
jgi:hypothetical protein